MKMLKRTLALMLVLCMMFTAVPFNAFATESTDEPSVPTTAPVDAPESDDPEEVVDDTADNTPDAVTPDNGIATASLDDGIETVAATSNKPADGTASVPFPTSIMGNGHYRIPALITTNDGTLVAAADARWHVWDTTDDNGDIDTIVSYSDDNGSNWNYSFANYIDNGNTTNYNAATFIDPALAYDGETIYMIVDLYPGQSGQTNCTNASNAGTGYDSQGRLMLSKSATATSNFSYYLDGGKIYSSAGKDQGYTVDAWFNVTSSTGVSCGNLFDYNNTCGFHPLMTSHLYLTKSTDDGKTWSAPQMLNAQVKGDSNTYYLVSPGRGFYDANTGAIIFGAYDSNNQASLIFSLDGGDTWERTGNVSGTSSENEIVQLEDGTLRMFFRNYNKDYTTSDYTIKYADATWNDSTYTYTWGSVQNTGVAAHCNTNVSAIAYSKYSGGKQVILVSCPADTSGPWNRTNGKIFTFLADPETNAMTKVNEYVVTSGAFSYSCMTELDDGTIGMLYEKGDSGNITYAEFSAETITGLTFDEGENVSSLENGVVISYTESAGVVDATAKEATVEGLDEYVAYDISLYTNDTNTQKYTGKAKVTLPLNGKFAASDVLRGFVVNADGTIEYIDKVERNTEADTATFTVPHFSVVGVEGQDANITNFVDVHIPLGGTSKTFTDNTGNYADDATIEDPTVARMNVTGKVGAAETVVSTTKATELKDGATYIMRVHNEPVALSSDRGKTDWGTQTLAFQENELVVNTKHMWTLEQVSGGYKIKNANGYLNLGAPGASGGSNAAYLNSTGEVFTIASTAEGWTIMNNAYNQYINTLGGLSNMTAGGWKTGSTTFDLYEVITSTPDTTEVSFTGLKIGKTTAVVGSTQYNIEVMDPAITSEVDVVVKVGDSVPFTDKTGLYTIVKDLDESIAKVTLSTSTVEGSIIFTPATTLSYGDKVYIQVSENIYLDKNGEYTIDFTEAELWTVAYIEGYFCSIRNSEGKYLQNNSSSKKPELVNYQSYITFANGVFMSQNTAIGTPGTVTHSDAINQTEITIIGVKPGETQAVIGSTRYNISVYDERDIAIYYQLDGTTVATDKLTVRDDVTEVALPAYVQDDNGTTYIISDTVLPLSENLNAYFVPVTSLNATVVDYDTTPIIGGSKYANYIIQDGKTYHEETSNPEGYEQPISGLIITEGSRYDLDVKDNQDVTWAVIGDAVSVNKNGLVTALKPAALTDHVYVTATIGEETYAIPVTVLPASGASAPNGGNIRIFDIYNGEELNCTSYYSYQGADLVEYPKGTQIYVEHSHDITELFTFLATPNEGFALTYVNSTAGEHYHLVLNENRDGYGYEGTHSDLHNMRDGGYTYLHDQLIAYVVRNDGSKAATTDQVHTLLNYAVAKGCEGAFFYSKGATDKSTNAYDIKDTASFIAEKLPEMEKEITSATVNDQVVTDLSKVNLGIGSTINYTISVFLAKPLDVDTYKQIDYTNFVLDDPLTGDKWTISATNNHTPGNSFTLTNAAGQTQTVTIETGTTNQFNYTLSNGKTYTYEGETTVYKFKTSLTLGARNFLEVVKDGKITNVAELSYNYQSFYSKGAHDGKSQAVAEVLVEVPQYVIDFGAPVTIDLTNDPLVKGDVITSAVAQYGNVTINDDRTMTYTPTTMLKGPDFITLTFNQGANDAAIKGYGVRVYPATTVYYEEGFMLENNSGWTTDNATTNPGTQTSEKLGKPIYNEGNKIIDHVTDQTHPYGYDPLYDGSYGASYAEGATIGNATTFSFTGDGFDLYANCTGLTGTVSVQVKNATGVLEKIFVVNTVVDAGDTAATTGQSGNQYNLPIVSMQGLAHGTYTVTVNKILNNGSVKLDGVRIYNTVEDSSVFYIDREDNPAFYQLRDSVLTAIHIDDTTSEDYGTLTEMANQVFAEMTAGGEAPEAVITDPTGIYGNGATAQDLLDNGPKNELFLYPNQTLTFKVTTNREMQIGLKAPVAGTTYTIACLDAKGESIYKDENNESVANKSFTLNTSVDMFYPIGNPIGTEQEYTISITNTGDKILSVTDLKICDDPSFAFAPLTVEDIAAVMGVVEEPEVPETPVEPEVPEETTKPTEPEVEETTKPSKPGKPSKPSKPGKPENTKPTEPQKPGKPGNNGNQKPGKPDKNEEKTYTLKITFVNLFGKKVGTATITTTNGVVSAYEIVGKAPARYKAIWFVPVTLNAHGTNQIVVPVI